MLPRTSTRSFLPSVGRRRCRSALSPSRCRLYTSIVDLAFRAAGCPRSVEYVEGVFGFDGLRLNVHCLGRFSKNIIEERVPIFVHRHLVSCMSDDNDLPNTGGFLRGPVCDLLEFD